MPGFAGAETAPTELTERVVERTGSQPAVHSPAHAKPPHTELPAVG
jgi:hypothetical protein